MKQVYLQRFSLLASSICLFFLTQLLIGSNMAQADSLFREPLSDDDHLLQPPNNNRALHFNGVDQYVTLGPVSQFGADAFTLELWFKWDGEGVAVNTGLDGVVAYPLLTKGRAEGDNSPADLNYFLGIRASDKVLAADLEEGADAVLPGQNHPITGVTPIVAGQWHHAAVTFDGRQWQLFLDGQFEAEIVVDQPIRSDSIQPAALATALNSRGTSAGYFAGALDEVRIWDKALSEQEIRTNINSELSSPQPHLLARWGFDEEAGDVISNSADQSLSATAVPGNITAVAGAPFNLAPSAAPNEPLLVQPADSATGVSTSPTLEVTVTDPEADAMTVTFYGRQLSSSVEDFTLIAMPDTQKYAEDFSPTFTAQTQWVVDNKDTLNIAHVTQLGDCVENADLETEWQFASAAFGLLEDSQTTGLPDGISYSIAVGNHDQDPADDPDGDSTALYNQYFGSSRFFGRSYYGGYYGSNFDNHYELFSAGGMDFIIISLEFDGTPTAVLDWVDNLLVTYSNRRAIIVTHYFINTGNPGNWGSQGQDIYDAVKDRPNVFLLHGGHKPGEGRRVDTYGGNTINTLLADYQGRPNNGDGWLRILEFSPNNDEVRVKTYSVTRDEFESDSDSEFTFDYEMLGAVDFQEIGQVSGVASGANASLTWSGLDLSTEYEWYVTVDDGNDTITGSTWSFTTTATTNLDPNVPSNPTPGDSTTGNSINTDLSWTGGDPDGDPVTYDLYLDTSDPPSLLQSGLTATNFDPGTLDYDTTYYWKIVANDNNSATAGGPVWQFSTVDNTGSSATQDIDMGPGWKMFSSYILPQDTDFMAIFNPIVTDIMLIKNAAGDVYWPDLSINEIVWDSCQGYKANLKVGPVTSSITGALIVPEVTECQLGAGWNLIAYLRDSALSVPTALATCSSDIVLVKNGAGEIYWPDFSVDQITDMLPGEGYELFLSAPCTLIYPANSP